MKNNGILSERKNEFRVRSKKELNGVKDYLEDQFNDTVGNLEWLASVLPEKEMGNLKELKEKYNGVGELKIEVTITHEV